MRIGIIGKFPPVQGGVSMRTYWTAHGLAARGHEVHVVTNAKEVQPPFRMHMRAEDWRRCEHAYGSGSVSVHWTDPVDASQSHIPMASPFVSKLAAIAARVHAEQPFDVVLSHYLEPYGVAGHLAAQIAGVPHVVRMAGSDAGRLWHHRQFEALYDHVLRSAEIVIATGSVAERAIQRGVASERIAFGGGFVVPEHLFAPAGPVLDIAALRHEIEAEGDLRAFLWGDFAADRPYFGVCGKLGGRKGSFALLAALSRLKQAGLDVGLVALAHGPPDVDRRFRTQARRLGVTDRVLQIPFLPHWRVPEFLRSCLAVCCLEQDFPIGFHSPIIPREVLLCGACLVASTEVIRKLPAHDRLSHGYGCVAIDDVNDVDALAERLAAIVRDPAPAPEVGRRGCLFARELQREIPFPHLLEQILQAAAAREKIPQEAAGDAPAARATRFAFAERAAARNVVDRAKAAPGCFGLAQARAILDDVQRDIAAGRADLKPLALAIETELAVAMAEEDAGDVDALDFDPLFRLHIARWALQDADLSALIPVRDPRVRVLAFDYDVAEFMAPRGGADLPVQPAPRRSHIVAFARAAGRYRSPLVVDARTARILTLSDGTRTAAEIVRDADQTAEAAGRHSLEWLEQLFVHGLISLRDRPAGLAHRAGTGGRRRELSSRNP
ncbi:MAG TPA: glycosyltransferase [Xanthobacteraceae bacterium]|nr:glycosyltransferase [Xanthobacteraceae bacterium]